MPRQSFYEPRQRAGDDRLQKLAALAQIYGGLNGQQNQAAQAQQQNALAVLGLIMQQQHQQEVLGLQRSGQEQDQGRFQAQQTQAAAELGAKNTWEQQKLESDKAAQQEALARAGLTNYASMPGATPESYARLAEAANVPGFAAFNSANKEAVVNNNVSQMQSLFGQTYSDFAKHPAQAQQGLNALWSDPRMQSPEVQARIQPYLQGQNDALYKGPQTAGGISAADVPQDLQAQFLSEKQTQQSELAQHTAALAAQEEAKKRAAALSVINAGRVSRLARQPMLGFSPQ